MCECKRVALTATTANGIERFQEKFGKWFIDLFPIVKERASYDQNQAFEPSLDIEVECSEENNQQGPEPVSSEKTESVRKELFIPEKGAKINKGSGRYEDCNNPSS